MEKELETEATRRPYHKPQLEQVQLVAEEAVLTGCKSASSGPHKQQHCNHPQQCTASIGT